MNVIIAGDFNDDLSLCDSKGLNSLNNIMNLHNLISCRSIYKGKKIILLEMILGMFPRLSIILFFIKSY